MLRRKSNNKPINARIFKTKVVYYIIIKTVKTCQRIQQNKIINH
jgi:hypothetical protein